MPVPTHVQHDKNLWVAAGDGDLDRVRELIETASMSPNAPDPYTYTPMHAAASYGHLHVLDYLISQGGDVNITDEDGDTPLYVVENVETARYLPAEYLAEDFQEVAVYLQTLPSPVAGSVAASAQAPLQTQQGPSQHAQNAVSENLTSSLLQSVEGIMERAEAEGRDPEGELRQAVSQTVLAGVVAGYGMSTAAFDDHEDRPDGSNDAKRSRTDDGPG
ncbi:ankyrin [Amylocystis lapponica]|nr:ankyrin [Amylocystis lapponica]